MTICSLLRRTRLKKPADHSSLRKYFLRGRTGNSSGETRANREYAMTVGRTRFRPVSAIEAQNALAACRT